MAQSEYLIIMVIVCVAILFILILGSRNQIRQLRAEIHRLSSANRQLDSRIAELEGSVMRSEEQTGNQETTSQNAATVRKPEPQTVSEDKPVLSQAQQTEHSAIKPRVKEIVTRTSRQDGGTVDTWVSERSWTDRELETLESMRLAGQSAQEIANTFRVDAKDVVYGLARGTYGCAGDLEDLAKAPNDGKRWLKQDHEKLIDLHRQALPIEEIAFRLGRTQLAIVWRLIDSGVG